MVRLRGHHLICLHFFLGEGYNPEFAANLKEVLNRVEAGEEIKILTDADDICRRCPYLKGESCLYDTDADEEIREMDRTAMELLGLESQARARWKEIKKKVPGVFRTWAGKYCRKCAWRHACEKNRDFLLSFLTSPPASLRP